MSGLRGTDIICISSIDWDFIWQGHQQIMSTLAEQGNRVLFIENTGVRAPRLRDFPRIRHRLRNWLKGTKGFRQVRQNLVVYSPVLLPFPYSKIACWINRQLLFGAVQRWMRATGFRHPLVWTFLPTPLVRDLIRDINPELTIYYCIDDLASSSSRATRIRRSEMELFREADLVFVTSEKLRQRASQVTDRVWIFPFGVDFSLFDEVRQSRNGIPEDLRALPRPIIGYVGGLHQWVDQDLISATAARMPHASFVLVGPSQTDVSRLSRQANIHLLNARPHAQIPTYIKGFDVGIISYRLTEYTTHVYPTKLNEYLAMGLPVIATDLPEIRRFNSEHGNLVTIVRSPAEFVEAIRAAQGAAGDERIRQRIEAARQNGWQARIEQMSAVIEQRRRMRQAEDQRWEASLYRLYRAARRQVYRAVFGLACSYLLLFHSPLVWWCAEPLRMAQAPRQADAVVVFAGGVGESGEAGGGYQERVKHAVDLYHDGWAPAMIFSSGYTFVFQEASIMKELAMSLDVPSDVIVLETTAANTRYNVISVRRLLQQHGWDSIVLVSSPYHMRRAMLTWRRLAPEVTVIPSPVPVSQFYAHDRGASLEQIRGILHEYLGIVYYWWKGWI